MTDDTKSDKDMHKSGWMVPPRTNVPRDESKPSKEKLAGMTIKHITVRSNAQVAQSVEQRTENPRVGGSIPPLGTNSPILTSTEPDA